MDHPPSLPKTDTPISLTWAPSWSSLITLSACLGLDAVTSGGGGPRWRLLAPSIPGHWKKGVNSLSGTSRDTGQRELVQSVGAGLSGAEPGAPDPSPTPPLRPRTISPEVCSRCALRASAPIDWISIRNPSPLRTALDESRSNLQSRC